MADAPHREQEIRLNEAAVLEAGLRGAVQARAGGWPWWKGTRKTGDLVRDMLVVLV